MISFSERENTAIPLFMPESGRYRIIFSTEGDGGVLETEGSENRLPLSLPPRSGVLLRRVADSVLL